MISMGLSDPQKCGSELRDKAQAWRDQSKKCWDLNDRQRHGSHQDFCEREAGVGGEWAEGSLGR